MIFGPNLNFLWLITIPSSSVELQRLLRRKLTSTKFPLCARHFQGTFYICFIQILKGSNYCFHHRNAERDSRWFSDLPKSVIKRKSSALVLSNTLPASPCRLPSYTQSPRRVLFSRPLPSPHKTHKVNQILTIILSIIRAADIC